MLLGTEPENHVLADLLRNQSSIRTYLGKCTCPSRGCSQKFPEADGSSLLQQPWECVRSTRSGGKSNPQKNRRCQRLAGTRFRSHPSPEGSVGGQMGSTTDRLLLNHR